MNTEFRDSLAELLSLAGQAHHEAFITSDGHDPDWPIWYANYLVEPLKRQLDLVFHKSQLVYCLMDADFEHQVRSPESNWQEYYANEIIERYAASENPEKDTLALYHFNGCPFCSMVRTVIGRLGIEVELRDIFADPQHREDLVGARGRGTVPVLRISAPDGSERWMPESRDIVRYLEKTFA